MTITYPLSTDFLHDFPGWTTEFDLLWRQEQSRMASGMTIVKDMGSPLWRMSVSSISLRPNDLDYWRARLTSLENGLKTFRAFPKSRCYPIAYPNGSWPTGAAFTGTGAVNVINANRKAISTKSFPVGYQHKAGDFVQIGAANLHQVMEDATTGQFEIRPHLWPASAVNDAVVVKRPSCIMAIVPGSISSTAELATGRGVISFQAVEAR